MKLQQHNPLAFNKTPPQHGNAQTYLNKTQPNQLQLSTTPSFGSQNQEGRRNLIKGLVTLPFFSILSACNTDFTQSNISPSLNRQELLKTEQLINQAELDTLQETLPQSKSNPLTLEECNFVNPYNNLDDKPPLVISNSSSDNPWHQQLANVIEKISPEDGSGAEFVDLVAQTRATNYTYRGARKSNLIFIRNSDVRLNITTGGYDDYVVEYLRRSENAQARLGRGTNVWSAMWPQHNRYDVTMGDGSTSSPSNNVVNFVGEAPANGNTGEFKFIHSNNTVFIPYGRNNNLEFNANKTQNNNGTGTGTTLVLLGEIPGYPTVKDGHFNNTYTVIGSETLPNATDPEDPNNNATHVVLNYTNARLHETNPQFISVKSIHSMEKTENEDSTITYIIHDRFSQNPGTLDMPENSEGNIIKLTNTDKVFIRDAADSSELSEYSPEELFREVNN